LEVTIIQNVEHQHENIGWLACALSRVIGLRLTIPGSFFLGLNLPGRVPRQISP
jgi:hypothetical protein